ncbi:rhomboid family intramembrane serine protease [Candidatus Micrarchaeota archaeon]|nr:rhomboid family intramembrane serine protease [Candidatus Micrarchaeota archaeon]
MRVLTVSLALLLVAAYLIMSGGFTYLPASATVDFGFYLYNWPGLLTYSFVHVGPAHIAGNLLVLLAAGLIAERKLRLHDFFAIYLLAGAASALLFAALEPSTVIVGASAAISGLLVAAFFIDFRKAILAVPAAIIVSSLVIGPVLDAEISGYYSSLNVSAEKLSMELNATIVREGEIGQKFAAGEINRSEYEQLIAAVNESKRNVTEQLVGALSAKQNIESGKERERESTVSTVSHVFGVLAGFAYLLAFKRDVVLGMPYQLPFIHGPSRKKHAALKHNAPLHGGRTARARKRPLARNR